MVTFALKCQSCVVATDIDHLQSQQYLLSAFMQEMFANSWPRAQP